MFNKFILTLFFFYFPGTVTVNDNEERLRK